MPGQPAVCETRPPRRGDQRRRAVPWSVCFALVAALATAGTLVFAPSLFRESLSDRTGRLPGDGSSPPTAAALTASVARSGKRRSSGTSAPPTAPKQRPSTTTTASPPQQPVASRKKTGGVARCNVVLPSAAAICALLASPANASQVEAVLAMTSSGGELLTRYSRDGGTPDLPPLCTDAWSPCGLRFQVNWSMWLHDAPPPRRRHATTPRLLEYVRGQQQQQQQGGPPLSDHQLQLDWSLQQFVFDANRSGTHNTSNTNTNATLQDALITGLLAVTRAAEGGLGSVALQPRRRTPVIVLQGDSMMRQLFQRIVSGLRGVEARDPHFDTVIRDDLCYEVFENDDVREEEPTLWPDENHTGNGGNSSSRPFRRRLLLSDRLTNHPVPHWDSDSAQKFAAAARKVADRVRRGEERSRPDHNGGKSGAGAAAAAAVAAAKRRSYASSLGGQRSLLRCGRYHPREQRRPILAIVFLWNPESTQLRAEWLALAPLAAHVLGHLYWERESHEAFSSMVRLGHTLLRGQIASRPDGIAAVQRWVAEAIRKRPAPISKRFDNQGPADETDPGEWAWRVNSAGAAMRWSVRAYFNRTVAESELVLQRSHHSNATLLPRLAPVVVEADVPETFLSAAASTASSLRRVVEAWQTRNRRSNGTAGPAAVWAGLAGEFDVAVHRQGIRLGATLQQQAAAIATKNTAVRDRLRNLTATPGHSCRPGQRPSRSAPCPVMIGAAAKSQQGTRLLPLHALSAALRGVVHRSDLHHFSCRLKTTRTTPRHLEMAQHVLSFLADAYPENGATARLRLAIDASGDGLMAATPAAEPLPLLDFGDATEKEDEVRLASGPEAWGGTFRCNDEANAVFAVALMELLIDAQQAM